MHDGDGLIVVMLSFDHRVCGALEFADSWLVALEGFGLVSIRLGELRARRGGRFDGGRPFGR